MRVIGADMHVIAEDMHVIAEDMHVIAGDMHVIAGDMHVIAGDMHVIVGDMHVIAGDVRRRGHPRTGVEFKPMAPQTATRMTYEEFMALPDDGKHYELIEGELVLNPAPVPRHQWILAKLQHALFAYLETHGTGRVYSAPIDVVLSSENVLEPDIIVLLSDRLSLIGPKNVQGPPNIVIEALSDRTRRKDEVTKRRLYEQYGVDEYWIFDPETDTAKIYRRSGDTFDRAIEINTEAGGAISSPVLPGFTLDVNYVFAE